ncbi:hypothetical protein AAZV13_07G121100 [Glycine max]
MMNRFCCEALNRIFRNFMASQNKDNATKLLRGKVIILDGDFKKILLVIRKG